MRILKHPYFKLTVAGIVIILGIIFTYIKIYGEEMDNFCKSIMPSAVIEDTSVVVVVVVGTIIILWCMI